VDKKIERKYPKWSKLAYWLLPVAGILVFAFVWVREKEVALRMDAEKVTVKKVEFGDFQEIITVNGTVEPLRTVRLDAREGGVVEEIFVENGQEVNAGQALMRLSNSTLMLDFMNRETQIVEQINNLRNTRITLEQNQRLSQDQYLDVVYQMNEQENQFYSDSILHEEEAIADLDYRSSKNTYDYLHSKKELLEQRLKEEENYRGGQIRRIDASIDLMERNLEAIRKNLENLTVRAPISGQLNSFDHEIGETKNRGENLGRIDLQGGFLLSALVDQHYLSRVREGLPAILRSDGKDYPMQAEKVFPTVQNNQFEVHLTFKGDVPGKIRRGQSLQIRLELSAREQALLLPRGAFYQSTGGQYVFVVDEFGKAWRRNISLGSQNPGYIKVLDGLEEGERVITSAYDAFGEAESLIVE
jgi:HlyD family secretion protein